MQFRAEQTFSAPIDAVARAYADPELFARLGDSPHLGRPEILYRWENGDVVHLDVRQRFTGVLSPAVTKVVDAARLTWVEHTIHRFARHEVEFRLAPDHYATKLRVSGMCHYFPAGRGTRRVVEADLVITGLPLVGKRVERAIASGLADHLTAEAPVVQRFLDGGFLDGDLLDGENGT